MNRAGFGAPPDEIEQVARLTPSEAVAALVNWKETPDATANPAWAQLDPDRAAKLKAYREAVGEERRRLQKERDQDQRARLLELQFWWLRRMATGPRPLQEKLALFWHGHFATSAAKVREPYLMWRQNDLFRRHGAGSWRILLDEVTRDPAMLIWLDQGQSRRPHPNENYARELLELFALGEGHYSERDVTEAARALTGLTLDQVKLEPVYQPKLHDQGKKTLFGRTDKLGVEDVLDLVVDHPSANQFITGKLWTFFAGSPPPPKLQKALTAEFRRSDRTFAPFLQTLLLAEEFYSPEVIRQQIKSPVQLLVMACRQLERPLPPAAVSTEVLRLLGQNLFNPPNVKGWDSGIAWINTNTLLTRHNLALLLITGQNSISGTQRKPAKSIGAVDPDHLFSRADQTSATHLLAAAERRFLNASLRSRERQVLLDYLAAQGELDDNDLLGLLRLLLCTPEYQLT